LKQKKRGFWGQPQEKNNNNNLVYQKKRMKKKEERLQGQMGNQCGKVLSLSFLNFEVLLV
jgi:hypothetical protein